MEEHITYFNDYFPQGNQTDPDPATKLLRYGKEKKKTPLEKSEDIEILRFVELGFKVKLVRMTDYSKPVDVKSDIKTVVKKIKKIKHNGNWR